MKCHYIIHYVISFLWRHQFFGMKLWSLNRKIRLSTFVSFNQWGHITCSKSVVLESLDSHVSQPIYDQLGFLGCMKLSLLTIYNSNKQNKNKIFLNNSDTEFSLNLSWFIWGHPLEVIDGFRWARVIEGHLRSSNEPVLC